MNWIGERVSWKDHGDKTTIVITPEKKQWQVSIFFAWMVLFTGIGGVMIYQLFQDLDRQSLIFTVIFLSFWLYFEIKLGRAFLWMAYGREYIKLNEAGISIKKAIGKYGKAELIYYQNISSFKLQDEEKNTYKNVFESSFWVIGGERFSVNSKLKNVNFGRKIPDQEARLLFKIVEKRLNKYKKQSLKS